MKHPKCSVTVTTANDTKSSYVKGPTRIPEQHRQLTDGWAVLTPGPSRKGWEGGGAAMFSVGVLESFSIAVSYCVSRKSLFIRTFAYSHMRSLSWSCCDAAMLRWDVVCRTGNTWYCQADSAQHNSAKSMPTVCVRVGRENGKVLGDVFSHKALYFYSYSFLNERYLIELFDAHKVLEQQYIQFPFRFSSK